MNDEAAGGGELDRVRGERDTADRRYNEALTALDRALRRLPSMPAAPPRFDPSGLPALEQLARIAPDERAAAGGIRGAVRRFVRRALAPVLDRQQRFNEAVVDHLGRNAPGQQETVNAIASTTVVLRDELEALATFQSRLLQFLQQVTPFVDTRLRVLESELASVRVAATVAERAATATARELRALPARGTAAGEHATDLSGARVTREDPADAATGFAHGDALTGLDGYKYVAFEDLHRGSAEAIRARLADYLPLFDGAAPVLDIGCGRGEFLAAMRERGVQAQGADTNGEMVALCRAAGLEAEQADGLTFLHRFAPGSVGGIFSAQVVEHLEPAYLLRLLDTAADVVRPGGVLVLETINPACWVAFFESYIRDPTHVRPLHPDTLKYLVVASGFTDVDVRFRSPVAPDAKLEAVPVPCADATPGAAALRGVAEAFNANVQRLNDRLFTYLDYAVIARRA